jgi:ketosteroid isomerase-like protein
MQEPRRDDPALSGKIDGVTSQPTPAELMRQIFPSTMDMVAFVRSGAGLPPGALERVSPDVEVEFLPPALGSQISGTGLEGMVEGWREWLEPYEAYVVETEDLEDLGGGDVLILVRVHARTHRDGVTIEHAPAAVATIRDGRLARIRFYLERDLARAENPRR